MGSKTDAFVKLGIVLSISLLSFSIGIFAGKKFSDNQHELAVLEPKKDSHGTREVASDSNETSAEGRVGAMTDEEIAQLAEEFVADETVPAHGAAAEETGEHHDGGAVKPTAHGHSAEAPTKSAAHAKSAPAKAHDEPSSAAKNIVAGKVPAAAAPAAKKPVSAEDRLPSSLPKDVAQFSVGKFTVQIAAYPNEAEAQKMAGDLKNKGYSAFYFPANVKGQTYYRVSVGQFATQKEAQNYRSEFLEKSKLSSAIVQKISR